MLNRSSLPPITAPADWVSWREGLLAGPVSALLRFLLVLAIISAITCLYVWQASTISAIGYQTDVLQAKVAYLEQQNVELMLQVAQWNAPGYVEDQARQQGLVPGELPVYVEVPDALTTSDQEEVASPRSVALWRSLTGWLPQREQAAEWFARLGAAVPAP